MAAVVSSGIASSAATEGLSSTEAQRRLREFGPNEIHREQATSPFVLLARQFESPVIWLLLGASVLSAALGEQLDAISIGAIVIVNAVIGFLQGHRAERAVMALRSMTAIVLCDRETVDGLAYWPGRIEEFWTSVGTILAAELSRCDGVIHVRTPALEHGYNHDNPLRTESAAAAADLDARILQTWQSHPRRFVVESFPDFLDKAARALDVLRGDMPDCCKQHVVPAIHGRQPLEGSMTS